MSVSFLSPDKKKVCLTRFTSSSSLLYKLMEIKYGAWLFSVLCLMCPSPSGCSCGLYPPGGAGLSSGAGSSAGLWGGDVSVWPARPRPAECSRCGGRSTRTCRAQVRTSLIPQVNNLHSTQHLKTDVSWCKAAMFVWLDYRVLLSLRRNLVCNSSQHDQHTSSWHPTVSSPSRVYWSFKKQISDISELPLCQGDKVNLT